MREAAIDFCDRLGAEAHALGWTAAELFGLYPEHGTLRVEFCGVLMVSGSKAMAVEPTRIVFDRGSGYRTKQGQVWGIPVWEFAKKGSPTLSRPAGSPRNRSGSRPTGRGS